MLCLTFDTDHCNETRMREWVAACRFPGRGTIFCTEPFGCLDGLGHEIAPHPFLPDKSDWDAEFKRMRQIFPAAKSWRAHSLASSQLTFVRLGQLGYEIASTVEMFGCADTRPFQSPWGIWQMPIYYMDNADFNRPDFGTLGNLRVFDPRLIEAAVAGQDVYVFDFHPVHYLLNTPHYAHYVKNVQAFKQGADLAALRFDGYGTASFFHDLVRAMDASGLRSLSLSEALSVWRSARTDGL